MKLSKLLLVPVVVLGMMNCASAQRSYAVLSLVGDSLTLQANRHEVGSHTNNAPRQVLAMDDQLYFTVRILPPRRVLVVADKKADVETWMVALESLDQGRQIVLLVRNRKTGVAEGFGAADGGLGNRWAGRLTTGSGDRTRSSPA